MEQSRLLREELVGFDAALFSGDDCRVLAEDLALTLKVVAAAQARAGARVRECGTHPEFRDGEEWLARKNGSSRRDARAAMELSKSGGVIGDALAAGEVSEAIAAEMAKAEKARPGSALELMTLARSGDLAGVRDESRRICLAAVKPEELHHRQHAARNFRHWRDDAGMVRMSGALAPAVGVALMSRLDAETDRLRRQGRRTKSTDSRDALAADALVSMLEGSGKGRATSSDVVFVCDLAAYRRGRTEGDEVCHIVGGGPVPVSVIADQLDDAFVKAVIRDGKKIDTVVHYGRHINAELRTALELGVPPDFDGVVCAKGCGRRYHLQWDHRDPVANRGPTSFENLQSLCWDCHAQKTESDRRAGLLGARSPAGAGTRAR